MEDWAIVTETIRNLGLLVFGLIATIFAYQQLKLRRNEVAQRRLRDALDLLESENKALRNAGVSMLAELAATRSPATNLAIIASVDYIGQVTDVNRQRTLLERTDGRIRMQVLGNKV